MRKVILACGILMGIMVLVLGLLAFRFRSFVGSFLSSGGGRINILVLGKGGIGHEAPDLTDTIILASVSEEKISLISLPRDIWVPEIRAKLNSAYYWGKLPLAKSTVEKITGQKILYGAVIDFSGFKGVVDALGGIEVEVRNSFTDEKYPIAGKEDDLCEGDKLFKCRYETVRFEKGVQMMDGETALKFVRSRNSQGLEGTDSARAIRQQVVVDAIKNKILASPWKIFALRDVIISSIETDIDSSALASVLRYAYKARENLVTISIPEKFLFNPPVSKRYDNQYVFISKAGDWSEVQKWIENLLSQ